MRPELEGLMVPSKLYGIAAAGRPIIAITASDGEIARLVRDRECGAIVAPRDGERLTYTLRSLRADTDRRARMGYHARVMPDDRLTRQHAL